MGWVPFWDLFVVGEFLLELEDLLAEQSDGAAAAVLVEDDAVLDVARPVGVLERVQRLHEVAVGRRAARDHQRPTARRKKKTNEKTNKQMNEVQCESGSRERGVATFLSSSL